MSKLRKRAQGRSCLVRIPGVCNGNPETTVLAHLPGGGMGRKQNDLFGAYACSSCHDAVDGRGAVRDIFGTPYTQIELRVMHLEGILRTQEQLIEEGVIPT